jgi:alanine racemase
MRETRERAWVEVDLDAVTDNARAIARAAGGTARLLPMVKADAYGLGAVPIAKRLETLDPWGYGVAATDEGAQLQAAGITRPILVFTPAVPSQFESYDTFQLRPVLDTREAISAWRTRGERPFHLEIDTGMRRSGVDPRQIDQLRDLLDTPALEGVFTHFHSADLAGSEGRQRTAEQFRRFMEACARLPRRPALLHASNSPGAFRDPAYSLDLVRPGIFLYGGKAGNDLPEPKPVAALRARVVSVRRLEPGDTVGYGAEWKAAKRTTVATLSIGYADGVRRSLQGKGQVLLGGKRRPLLGRIAMDMVVVDAGGDAVRVNDVATLIGRDGTEAITVDEIGAQAGTNSYEILTGLGKRLPRVYE